MSDLLLRIGDPKPYATDLWLGTLIEDDDDAVPNGDGLVNVTEWD